MKDIDIIIKYLSSYRFESYEMLYSTYFTDVSDGPLDLYKANINFSKDIYELLSYFEIFFRNKIDMILSKYICEDWIDNIKWRDKHLLQISEAKDKLKRKKKQYNKNDIIANLQLGFWIHLFDKNYQSLLWHKALNKIFPVRTNRQEISNQLKDVGELRNRISHYEIIIKDFAFLQKNIKNIVNIIKSIDEDLCNWTINNCIIFKKIQEANKQ